MLCAAIIGLLLMLLAVCITFAVLGLRTTGKNGQKWLDFNFDSSDPFYYTERTYSPPISSSPTAQHLVNEDLLNNRVIDQGRQHANRFEKTGKSLWATPTSASSIPYYPYNLTNVCLTKGCVRAASELIKNMDEEVSPCDDFYKFACGGWIKNQVIPDDRTTVSVFSLIQDELNHKLRG